MIRIEWNGREVEVDVPADIREQVIRAEMEDNPNFSENAKDLLRYLPIENIVEDAIALGLIPNPECD